jgi:hypothetical protein
MIIIYQYNLEENKTVLTRIYKYNLIHEKFVEKKQRFTGQVNRPGTITNLITIGRRNRFIIDLVEEILNLNTRGVIIKKSVPSYYVADHNIGILGK